MTDLKDVIFISLQDGYYNISLYYPNKNSNAINYIKHGEPFTYAYDGVTFEIFQKYSKNNYAITDIYAFEQQMNNFPPYLYKFDYEELAYLAIREIFKISLEKYKKDTEKYGIRTPLFKIVYSDCYRSIQHKKKCLYEYFNVAIAQNETSFNINPNNLTVDFASNVYPYYLYEKTIYVGMGAPLELKQKFKHCIFDIGYTTITCYIYYFETRKMKENLSANLVKSKERNVIVSHKLINVSVIPSGIFSFISSIYYELIEENKSEKIHPNSSYDYDYGVQTLIPELTTNDIPSFNTITEGKFKDSHGDKKEISKKNIFTTSIMSSVDKQISTIIRSDNIESYHINSIASFRWFFDHLRLAFYETNGYDKLLIDSLLYRYGIINNLFYEVDILKELPKEFESALKDDEIIYEEKDKRFCRKRTSIFPELQIDTETKEFKLDPIENINDYIKLSEYVNGLNVKRQEFLRIKNKFDKIKSNLSKQYDVKKLNGMYNKLIMLALNEPLLLEKYLSDFVKDPETYL